MINTTAFTNTTGNVMVAEMQAINQASDYVFGFGLLIAIFIILLFIMTRTFGIRPALGAASYFAGIAAVFLRAMGLINDLVLYGVIIEIIAVTLLLWFSRDEGT